ncbi:unnamed protein product, partial [Meganyctiphanes norvegica]
MAPYRHIYGEEFITETCLDLKFQISPDAFFQVNTAGGEVLYETVREIAEVSPITTLLDVCCGTVVLHVVMSPTMKAFEGIHKILSAVDRLEKTHNATVKWTKLHFTLAAREWFLPGVTTTLCECSYGIVNTHVSSFSPVCILIWRCESSYVIMYPHMACKTTITALIRFLSSCTQTTSLQYESSSSIVRIHIIDIEIQPKKDLSFDRVIG